MQQMKYNVRLFGQLYYLLSLFQSKNEILWTGIRAQCVRTKVVRVLGWMKYIRISGRVSSFIWIRCRCVCLLHTNTGYVYNIHKWLVHMSTTKTMSTSSTSYDTMESNNNNRDKSTKRKYTSSAQEIEHICFPFIEFTRENFYQMSQQWEHRLDLYTNKCRQHTRTTRKREENDMNRRYRSPKHSLKLRQIFSVFVAAIPVPINLSPPPLFLSVCLL